MAGIILTAGECQPVHAKCALQVCGGIILFLRVVYGKYSKYFAENEC